MSDLLTVEDLEAAKKHDTFHSEVISGKAGGVAGGTSIDYATNAVTGQQQKTLPAILRDIGYQQVGTFAVGYTLTNTMQTLLASTGRWYSWVGTFPHVVTAGTDPLSDTVNWIDRTEDQLRDEVYATVRESIRRSYAEAGLNLVDGSFELGGETTGLNDVLLCEADGKAYSWHLDESKIVAAGSDPTNIGTEWLDKSGILLKNNLKAENVKSSYDYSIEYATSSRIRPTENSASAINAAAQLAITNKCALDLTGVTQWDINEQLVLTGVPVIIASFLSPIVVDVAGTYANGYAVEIGDPSVDFNNGRSLTTLIGGMLVNASSRSTALNGVYLKGSWMNLGHIRANNFNGCGISADSVWDSTIQRLSAELCGNVTTYAIKLWSNGDTFNATNIVSLQSEQAYHKSIYANVLRTVIQNIHAERTYQLTTNDGASNADGSTWLNSDILLSNSIIAQCVVDSATVNAPTGEAIVAGQTYRIKINGDNSEASSFVVFGKVFQTYGSNLKLSTIFASDLYLTHPADKTIVENINVISLSANAPCTITGGKIYNWRNQFNAKNQSFFNVDIDNVLSENLYLGDIDFNNCKINTINDTKAASDANYSEIEFNNCTIQNCIGGWNSRAKFNGGKIIAANLASQCLFNFRHVNFGTFNPAGNNGYITRACDAGTINAWSYPTHVNYPAGTVTERIGYNSAGKIYQNTDSAMNWAKIA